jgi:hypothetical protein
MVYWFGGTVGSERFADLAGGERALDMYIVATSAKRRADPQRPSQGRRPCDVGLTRHGAF